jgi:tRNA wybutosine-synthesizing protein 3
MTTMERRRNNFENSKAQCLGKRDKSFAGRIDVHAVEICSIINERDEFYTTSSCSGRCFLYKGHGVKSRLEETNSFERCRISHELVTDPKRYFDLQTLAEDPTGGADPIRSVGQFEHSQQLKQLQGEIAQERAKVEVVERSDQTIWLRFEPFILHVCCRSLPAAWTIMNASRPSFKNVGLTSWKESKYVVAIWGDEGLDMPLSTPNGDALYVSHEEWLARLVNERHERNWNKIDRFVEGVRTIPLNEEDTEEGTRGGDPEGGGGSNLTVPRSFDVVGDIALLHNMPPGDETERRRIGEVIMKKNKAIKVSHDCERLDAALRHAHPCPFRCISAMRCPHVESGRD